MKLLQIVPRERHAPLRRDDQEAGRDPQKRARTFSGLGAGKRHAARWTHVRYQGSINLEPGAADAVEVAIKSPERGDEARLLSSFLGWLDRHFGEELSSVNIISNTGRAGETAFP